MVKINIGNSQVNISAGELSRNVDFSKADGRKFTVGGQKYSLNQIMKSTLAELPNKKFEEISEIKNTFKKLAETGYGEREKLANADPLTKIVASVKHAIGSIERHFLFKQLESFENTQLKQAFEAAKNDPTGEGNYQLGECYAYGIGVEQNEDKAKSYYKISSDKGYPKGELNYAVLLMEDDEKRGFELLESAASKGENEAQALLGFCHEEGFGTSINQEEAFKKYSLAANQGSRIGQYYLAHCYERGIGCAKNETKAFENYKLAADQGHNFALLEVATCYHSGFGCEKDQIKAFEYYQLAADQGNSIAQRELGNRFVSGNGCQRDSILALKYYQLAAEQNDSDALFELGKCQETGDLGCAVDIEKALHLYKRALDNEIIDREKIQERGTKLFKQLQTQVTTPDNQYKLGLCYEYGFGDDPSKANLYYQRAASQGYQKAKEKLGV